MIYNLFFHPLALKEWKKLAPSIQQQFKKALKKRLASPHVKSAALRGKLKNCYKIKLRDSGYRLVYSVEDDELKIVVVAVGKRDKSQAYLLAEKRQ